MMISAQYTRMELLRTFRNRRFFIFSLGFPVVLFLTIAGANKSQTIADVPFPTYYMVGMVSFGTMAAVLGIGARIAVERQVGWNRQLRITPLSPVAYMATKVATGYMMAICTIVILYLIGGLYGVSLAAANWAQMTVLILIGLIPFAAMGVALGQLLSPDSMGPVMGGGVALFSILGGAYGPLSTSGAFKDVTEIVPSYWLVAARSAGLHGQWWSAEGWIVTAAWSAVLIRLAMWSYRRDTSRV
ncbi:MAG TPA: ABC transporter permease [Acidimicrobiales bacterium]|jgi:ABC-2 type transport system permease protein|nr:ABC transporter permease [Acidimicrobiales bacterium]